MYEKYSVENDFAIIKKNHKKYLETNIVTHLDITGATDKKPIIDRYLGYINNYQQRQKSYLDNAIRDMTTAEKAGGGITAALIGLGIGGLIFASEQNLPSADLFGAKTITQGGFSAMIGASCGALIYKAWSNSQEKPMHADYATCLEQMKNAGFSDKKYADLSQDLVKLFHFRECLLLGLKDDHQVNLRTAFQDRYFPAEHAADFNNDDLNLSIEVYFLDELNTLFHKAFQDIYQIHDQEIADEKEELGFIRWIKKHFQSAENQQLFTQQMQVEFMSQCIHFLEKQMSEPSFIANYIYVADSLAGLIAGAIAVGAIAFCIPFIPVFGLAGIAIVSFAIAAVSTHLAVTKNDQLLYQRNQANRDSIHEAIQRIGSEQKRLTQLIQKVVKTSRKDLQDLKQYDEQDNVSFLKIIQGKDQPNIFIGSVHSWVREFANRFNESKLIEIDLSNRVKTIINDSHDQTHYLKALILSLLSTNPQTSDLKALMKYINDTRQYLKHPDNQEFIATFESVQKIKEQILEIIGYITLVQPKRGLPSILVSFFTDPLSKGGLGGLKSDLIQAMHLAPIVSPTVAANEHHPYHRLLDTAFNINLKLNASPSPMILQGDSQYRQMLGFPPDHFPQIEDQIHVGNITDYLNSSFDFLCSLNEYNGNNGWRQPFQNHDQFILYRMLLVKQLANIADVNNIRVDPLVKEEINAFARTKLNCNPDVALDDILHQSWLMSTHTDKRIITDAFDNPHTIGELASIADAVRVDITYVSNPLTPEQLIAFEANLFLNKSIYTYVFACLSSHQIIPEFSAQFHQIVDQTMIATTAFIDILKTRSLLQQTNTIAIYVHEISKDIERLIVQMNLLLETPNNASTELSRSLMQAKIQTLESFKLALPQFPPSDANVMSTPDELLIEYNDVPFLKASDESHLRHFFFYANRFIAKHNPMHPSQQIMTPELSAATISIAIKELEALIISKTLPPSNGIFSTKPVFRNLSAFHKQSSEIKAATRLKDALTQLQQGKICEEYDWNQNETVRTSKSLQKIIHKHFYDGLNHFFEQENNRYILPAAAM